MFVLALKIEDVTGLQMKKTGNAMIKKIQFLLCSWVLLTSLHVFAATKIDSRLNHDVIGLGEQLILEIIVEDEGQESPQIDQAPDVAGFNLINQFTSRSSRSGLTTDDKGQYHMSYMMQTSFKYIYQPTAVGNFKIPASKITLHNKVYTTKELKVRVEKKSHQPQQNAPEDFDSEEDPVDAMLQYMLRKNGMLANPNGGFRTQPLNENDAFFIDAQPDKMTAYLGEQITVHWYIYTKGVIRDLDTLKYPELKGFWKEDLEISTRLNFTEETLNGALYRKALLVSYALFPIKEGEVEIDPYKAKCTVVPMTNFGAALGQAYSFTKISRPIKVKVLPLPTQGRPSDFTGAVGQYNIATSLDSKSLLTNQAFSLKIRIEGRGNAKTIDMPNLNLPPGIEIYDTKKESQFTKNGTSFKEFEAVLIPRTPGDFTLPAITLSYFDPAQKKYVKKQTEPKLVHVMKSAQDPQVPSLAMKGSPSSKEPEAQAKEYHPQIEVQIRSKSNLDLWMRTILIVMFILSMLTFVMKLRLELGKGEKKRDILRLLKFRVKKVNKILSLDPNIVGSRKAATEAINIVYFILGELSGQGGAIVEVEKLILYIPPSVRKELGSQLESKISELQKISFAPEAMITEYQDVDKTKKLVYEVAEVLEKAVVLSLSDELSSASAKAPKTF